MMLETSYNSPIVEPFFRDLGVDLYLKREDLLHPYISGNKFRKLKYNLEEARQQKKHTLLTFGGAYSNHIHATAYAGKKYGFKTIGIIRGDELGEDIEKTLAQNTTLAFAQKQGMQLHFVSRNDYKLKNSKDYLTRLENKFGNFYVLPEGGTNPLAVKGCQEILTQTDSEFDYICCAVGTGGTLSGIINSASPNQEVIGFPVLKENYLHEPIKKYTNHRKWKLNREYHLGGYAKINTELITFINRFFKQHSITLDPIYTGKLLMGVYKEISKGNFPKNSRILAVHTGGLQGIAGVNSRLQKKHQDIIKTSYEF